MEFYFCNALASSTQSSYGSAKKRYLSFCQKYNLNPTPASEHQLCQYIAGLALENLSHNTIKCYLSAIRHLHIDRGLGDPGISKMARLEQVLRGVKSVQAKRNIKEKPRLPISLDILRKLRTVWLNEHSNNSRMLWAAASMCFFGFLRSGELTVPSISGYDAGAHLSVNDVTVDSLDSPQVLKVKIKASKTDPFRVGVDIYIGRSQCSLCPVTAVLTYMAIRGSAPGPLFMFTNGCPLTRSCFVAKVKEALTLAGVDNVCYSGHSFRSGAATTAAEQGIGETTIKTLGRWRSNAYQVYIKTPRDHLAQVSRRLTGKEA